MGAICFQSVKMGGHLLRISIETVENSCFLTTIAKSGWGAFGRDELHGRYVSYYGIVFE